MRGLEGLRREKSLFRHFLIHSLRREEMFGATEGMAVVPPFASSPSSLLDALIFPFTSCSVSPPISPPSSLLDAPDFSFTVYLVSPPISPPSFRDVGPLWIFPLRLSPFPS